MTAARAPRRLVLQFVARPEDLCRVWAGSEEWSSRASVRAAYRRLVVPYGRIRERLHLQLVLTRLRNGPPIGIRLWNAGHRRFRYRTRLHVADSPSARFV